MSRDEGFAIADTDTGLMSDPKVLALARRLRDGQRTAAALTLYEAVRLASWKSGQRLVLDDTVPAWWLESFDDLAVELVEVGLLDAERRIPAHAWESWFGPAYARREHYRELGARGGRAKARSSARSSVRSSARSTPSVPTGPTGLPARAREESSKTTERENGSDLEPVESGDLPPDIRDGIAAARERAAAEASA